MSADLTRAGERTLGIQDSSASGGRARSTRSQWSLAWWQFRRHRLALVSAVTFLLLCASALLAPLSAYDPNRTSLLDRFEPPSLTHPMGTDDLGRDELTRILIGGRVSLAVGLLAMLVSVVIGTLVGACAGYFGGLLDS